MSDEWEPGIGSAQIKADAEKERLAQLLREGDLDGFTEATGASGEQP